MNIDLINEPHERDDFMTNFTDICILYYVLCLGEKNNRNLIAMSTFSVSNYYKKFVFLFSVYILYPVWFILIIIVH